jgi:hypothetical protein
MPEASRAGKRPQAHILRVAQKCPHALAGNGPSLPVIPGDRRAAPVRFHAEIGARPTLSPLSIARDENALRFYQQPCKPVLVAVSGTRYQKAPYPLPAPA